MPPRDERAFLLDICEAVAQLQKNEPELIEEFSDVREIIAFRNILVHGYYVVSHDIVWTIITTRLPTLRDEAASALRQRSDADQPPG